MSDAPAVRTRLASVAFGGLAGWPDDDHTAAFRAFRAGAATLRDHPPKVRALGIDAGRLAELIAQAASLGEPTPSGVRAFFEKHFEPREGASPGFFTGYYEPVVRGSPTPTADLRTPLYGLPGDLVEIDGPAHGLPADYRFARRTPAGVEEYPDRAAIEAGFLVGRGLELVFLDPVDAFFIHVQGSARIELPDSRSLRVTYAGKSGQPYTAIGKVLVDAGELALAEADMAGIRGWLAAHPERAPALMARNRSFIFFRVAEPAGPDDGPVAAAKVPLSAGRSLAVDRLLHTFHAPVWIETALPDGTPFRRLMIAQDTGSAIVGPARGDIFFGSGDAAGRIAGSMRAAGRFVILAPRAGSA